MTKLELTLNGTLQSFEGPLSVAALIALVGAPQGAVAVEVDRKVIPRGEHTVHMLRGGERVEVVTIVGGG